MVEKRADDAAATNTLRAATEVVDLAPAPKNLVCVTVGVHYDYTGGAVWLGIGR